VNATHRDRSPERHGAQPPTRPLWAETSFVRGSAAWVLAVRSQVFGHSGAPRLQRGPQGHVRLHRGRREQTATAAHGASRHRARAMGHHQKRPCNRAIKVVIEGPETQLRAWARRSRLARPPPQVTTDEGAPGSPDSVPDPNQPGAGKKRKSTAEPRREHLRAVRTAAPSRRTLARHRYPDRRYRRVPRFTGLRRLPQVDYPTIVVSTFICPAPAGKTMSATVTTPLERQFGQMPSLSLMTSVSSFGSSQIHPAIYPSIAISTAAEQDVQAAINAAANLLPKTLPTPPSYSKSNTRPTRPSSRSSVSSDTLALSQVDDYADSIPRAKDLGRSRAWV